MKRLENVIWSWGIKKNSQKEKCIMCLTTITLDELAMV